MVSDTAPAGPPFAGRTVAIIVAVTALSFGAFLLLLAFGGDARRGHDARAHALSVSGDGFAGLVELVHDVGYAPLMVRERAAESAPDLLIATPPAGSDGAALAALVARREGRPTLIVLPKWVTRPLGKNRAWGEAVGIYPAQAVLAPLAKLAPGVRLGQTAVAAPERLAFARIGPKEPQQRLAGTALEPLLVDAAGRLVLARLPGRAVFLLAEPDLLDNVGLGQPPVAAAAMALVDRLSPNNEIAFDLTLNGLGTTHGTLRLLFEPPVLPATLCLALAALLAGLHGAARFGAPDPTARVVAFGKTALLNNTAVLVRAAGKERRLGPAYAAVALAAATEQAGIPAGSDAEGLATQLDRPRLAHGHPTFGALAAAASAARTRPELVAAARALHDWMRNTTA